MKNGSITSVSWEELVAVGSKFLVQVHQEDLPGVKGIVTHHDVGSFLVATRPNRSKDFKDECAYLAPQNGNGVQALAKQLRMNLTECWFLVKTHFEDYLGHTYVVGVSDKGPYARGFAQYCSRPLSFKAEPGSYVIGLGKRVYAKGQLCNKGQAAFYELDAEDTKKIKADEALADKIKGAHQKVFDHLAEKPFVTFVEEGIMAMGAFCAGDDRFVLVLIKPRPIPDQRAKSARLFMARVKCHEPGWYIVKTKSGDNPTEFTSPGEASADFEKIPVLKACFDGLREGIEDLIRRVREQKQVKK